MRIPVVDKNNQPLMPTTPARARKWVESGKAVKRWSKCGQFYVQLTVEPSGSDTQDIIIGIDRISYQLPVTSYQIKILFGTSPCFLNMEVCRKMYARDT